MLLKKIKIPKQIINQTEISSDSDLENSDEESSDKEIHEGNSDEENSTNINIIKNYLTIKEIIVYHIKNNQFF